MKRAFLTHILFLVLLALAAATTQVQDAVTTDSLTSPSSSPTNSQEASAPISFSPQTDHDESSEEAPSTDGLLAEFDRLTATNATLSTADSDANDVSTAYEKDYWKKHLKGWYRVDVRIGTEATHAGTFQGDRMYERLYSLLKSCVKGARINDCSILNVVYADGAKNYRTDSALILDVEHAYFNPEVPGLQDLGYRMMAKVYQKMTEVPRNCRRANFDGNKGGDRDLYFCAVPSRALIVYPTNGGPVQMVLKIKLEWDHKTTSSDYECDGYSETGVAEYASVPFRKGYNEEIAKIQGWKSNRVTTFAGCYYPKCFNTDPSRNDMDWKENEDECIARENPRGCSSTEKPGRGDTSLNCPPDYYGTRSEFQGKPGSRDNNPNIIHWK